MPVNPATFQTPNSWQASGALGGFLAGMNQDIANGAVARDFRDQDLEYAINQIRQQAAQSNLGVTQADNANKILAAGVLKNQYDTGMQQQLADTGVQAGIETNQATVAKTKEQLQQMAAPIFVEADQFLKANGGKVDWTDPNQAAQWKSYADRARSLGVKDFPYMPDQADAVKFDQYAQSAEKFIGAKAQAITETIPQQQSLAKIRAENEGKQAVANTQANASIKGHELMAGAQRYSADQRLAVAETMQLRMSTDQGAMNLLIAKANKNGWTENDVGQADYLQSQIMQSRAYIKISQLGAYASPEDRQKIINQVQQEGEQELRAMPGYAAAKAKFGGGGGAATAPSAASVPKGQATVSGVTGTSDVKDDLPKIKAGLEASGQKYEPDKYMYMVTPDGKILRKPH